MIFAQALTVEEFIGTGDANAVVVENIAEKQSNENLL